MAREKFIKPLSLEFIVAGVLALFNLALDQADIHSLLITWLSILACPCLMLDGLRRTEWSTRVGRKSLRFIAASIGIVGAFAWIAVAVYMKHKAREETIASPKEETQRDEFHIDAELSVDFTKKNDAAIRVLLENVGIGKISSLRSFVQTDAISAWILLPGPSEIAPHEKTELESGLFLAKKPSEVTVYLAYESNEHEPHYSEYRFVVPALASGGQPVLPVFTKEGIGELFSLDLAAKDSVIKGFTQPTGTILFFFPKKNANGSPNQIFMYAGNRAVAVNSLTHKAAVWRGLSQIERLAEVNITEQPGGINGVGVIWDDRTGMLGVQVDGGPRKYATKLLPARN